LAGINEATSEASGNDESGAGEFVLPPPPPPRSRNKKRHLTSSGEKPPSKEVKGEGDFRDRSESRYSSRYGADGRGRGGRSNHGNGNGRDNGKNFDSYRKSLIDAGTAANPSLNAGSAATKQRNGQKAANIPANDPGLPGAQGSSAIKRDNLNPKVTITGTTSKSRSLLESNSTGEPATSPRRTLLSLVRRIPITGVMPLMV
jgi:hypothetical protein